MSSLATPKTGHIPSLDGMRAISIAVVFAGHAGLPPLVRDTSGVTIFFFLSGFLITTLLQSERSSFGRISVRNFYLRRVFRILPVMYVVLGLVILANLAGWLQNDMTAAGAAASGLQVTNYWIVVNGRDGLPESLNALWSLNVEEHYYLVFPVLQILLWKFLPSRRAQGWFLGSLCALFLAWRCYLYFVADAGFDRVYLATDTRADSILFGALLATVCNPFSGRALFGGRHPMRLFFGGLAFFAAARVLPEAGMLTVGHTVEAMGLFLIFTSVITAPNTFVGRFLNWRPVAFVGVLSYSFYLVHRPVLLLLEEHLPLGTWLTAGAGLLLSLAVSYALYRAVELPFGKLRRKFHGANRPPIVQQHTAA